MLLMKHFLEVFLRCKLDSAVAFLLDPQHELLENLITTLLIFKGKSALHLLNIPRQFNRLLKRAHVEV